MQISHYKEKEYIQCWKKKNLEIWTKLLQLVNKVHLIMSVGVQFLKDATYEIMCYRELITCEKEPLRGLTETADNVQMILKTAQQTPNTSRSVRIDNIRAL